MEQSLVSSGKYLPVTKPQTLWGAVMAVLLIVAVGVIFYTNIFRIAESAEYRQRSYLTVIYLEKYFSTLKDAETGQRGFLLTEKISYLTPYNQALREVSFNWRQMMRYVSFENTQEKKQFETLQALSERKKQELAYSLQVYQHQGQAAALKVVQSGEGKNLMDQIRLLIAQIEQRREAVVAYQNEQLATNTRNSIIFSILIGLIAVCLFLFIIVMLVREGSRRQALYDQLEAETKERQKANIQLQEEIKEREQARTQIDNLNKTLENKIVSLDAVNKELEAFSYSVSHDLRAPLRSIDGFSQALLNKYSDQLDDNGKDYLNRVRANSQRMAQLIDDMLQLSRLTRGELHLTEVNLSALAEEIIQENRELEPHRKVSVMIQENLTTNGDKRLLQAVLQNLLNNAWKFTSQKEEATIEFKTVLQDDRPVYMVRDDGAGFEMEFVDKLFGAFQRLHAMHEFPGTGIGLATVQRIIHRHGGKVWAEGEPDKGARFYFTINSQNID